MATLADYVPIIIAIVGSGGIIGSVIAFMKVRPEAGQIAATAAGSALEVQIGVIETLRVENVNLRTRLEEMESKVALMMDLRERVEGLEDEREKLRRENGRLRKRVAALEQQVRAMGEEPINGDHS